MAHHAIISPSLETLKIIPETGDDDDEEIDVVEDSAPTPTEVDFKSESDVSDSVVVMAEEAPVETTQALPASSTDDLSNFRATLLQMILMANKSDSENNSPQQLPKTEPELPEQVC